VAALAAGTTRENAAVFNRISLFTIIAPCMVALRAR
jgi:hypothetical protein